jgi:hypothetical protein
MARVVCLVHEDRQPDKDVFVLADGERRIGVLAVLSGIGGEHGDAGLAECRLELPREELGKIVGDARG